MMKYVATAAVAATFTASAAFAGGVAAPIYEAAPQAVYVAPAAGGWAGGYVGGNLSYGKGKVKGPVPSFPQIQDQARGTFSPEQEAEFFEDYASGGFPVGVLANPDGASGALRLGYDWQSGAGVFGLGAEYNFGKYKDSFILNGFRDSIPVGVEIKNAATIFARAGYAMNDNFMAYGLLGYTWAKGTASWSDFGGGTGSRDLKGGTIGLGAEYKLNSNWSTYGEYTYTDFGTVENTNGLIKATLGQAKLGINYRF